MQLKYIQGIDLVSYLRWIYPSNLICHLYGENKQTPKKLYSNTLNLICTKYGVNKTI